jgi:uncharacterized protein YrrD
MARLLMIVACLVLASCASTKIDQNGYIRTTGEGSSLEQAKQVAFREAIQIQVGTIVLSERESNNLRTIKDDILVHSSGYVDDYKVINQSNSGNRVSVTVDVKVRTSKIADRLLNRGGSSGDIQGDRASTQYSSYMSERKSGDAVLARLLSDFPAVAMSIKQERHEFKLDAYRNAMIIIPYEIRWQPKYLAALKEALGGLQDGDTSHYAASVIVLSKNEGDWFGNKRAYHFNDKVRVQQIKDALNQQIMIKAKVSTFTGKELYSGCFMSTQTFRGTHPSGPYVVWGNDVEQRYVEIKIDPNSSLARNLKDAEKIELTLQANDC